MRVFATISPPPPPPPPPVVFQPHIMTPARMPILMADGSTAMVEIQLMSDGSIRWLNYETENR